MAITAAKPFKAWVQMVLPQVYEDALSYQELAYKCVAYINQLIESDETIEYNIEQLKTMVEALEDYVNEYFENLDVTEAIDNKLDELAADGTLTGLLYGSALAVAGIDKLNTTLVCKINKDGYSLQGIELFSDELVVLGWGTYGEQTGYISLTNVNTGVDVARYPESGTMDTHGVGLVYHDGYTYFNSYGETALYRIATTSSGFGELEELSLPESLSAWTTVFFHNDEMYYNYSDKVYDADGNLVFTMDYPDNKPRTPQDHKFLSKYIVSCYSNPNTIYVFDYTGRFIKSIDLGYYCGEWFSLGEMESVCEHGDDGEIYLCSQLYYVNKAQRFNLIMRANLYHNEKAGTLTYPATWYPNNTYIIYADADAGDGFQDGSESYPFSRLEDTLYCNTQGKTVNIFATGNTEFPDDNLQIKEGNYYIRYGTVNSIDVANGFLWARDMIIDTEDTTYAPDYSNAYHHLLVRPRGNFAGTDITIKGLALNSALTGLQSSIYIDGLTQESEDTYGPVGDCCQVTMRNYDGKAHFNNSNNMRLYGVTNELLLNANQQALLAQNAGVGTFSLNYAVGPGAILKIVCTGFVHVFMMHEFGTTYNFPLIGANTSTLYLGRLGVTFNSDQTVTVASNKFKIADNGDGTCALTSTVYSSNSEAISGSNYLWRIYSIQF